MARQDEHRKRPPGKAAVSRSRSGKPAWSSERAPFQGLPARDSAALRDELGKKVARWTSETGLGFGNLSSDPANRRGGPRSPDVAREGLVPSPLLDKDAVRAMVVECVRLAARLLQSPLAEAAPAAYELAAVRDIRRVLSKYVGARRRAQAQAVRASALTALAAVYQEHCRSWPVATPGAATVDPRLERAARAKMLHAVRTVLTTPVYRGAIGDVDALPLEAFVNTPEEIRGQVDGGGAVKLAAEVLGKVSGTSAHAFQNARRRSQLEISRDILPASFSLPDVSLAPKFGDQVAAEAGSFVMEVFRSRLGVEPGDYVEYGISGQRPETPDKPPRRGRPPRSR